MEGEGDEEMEGGRFRGKDYGVERVDLQSVVRSTEA